MATKNKSVKPKTKPETVRERAAKQTAKKQPRKRKLPGAQKARAGKSKVRSFLTQTVQTHEHKEDSKLSPLTKHRSLVPPYFRNAFSELKNVRWPRVPEALRLTLAVIIFAAVFTAFISSLDWVLEKIFEELILNESQNIRQFIRDLF